MTGASHQTPAQRPAARELHERLAAAEARHRQDLHAVFWQRSLRQQATLFALLLLLWQLPVFNPIKLLVVLFHELSHTVAAYATGGIVFGIAIDPGGAGVTLGIGGWLPGIVVAGYAGSLLFGALLYYLCAIWEAREVWFALTVCAFGSLALRFFNDFTASFMVGTLILLTAGLRLRPSWQQTLLRLVATSSCLYPLIDVLGEVVTRERSGFTYNGVVVGSDVGQLALLTGLSVWLLALIWITIGAAAVVWLMMTTATLEAQTEVKKSILPPPPPKGDQGHRIDKRLVYTSRGPYTSEYTIP